MANDIWRSTLSSHFQTISSHYYNITDSESWPVAGLLVLLDSHERPVRSELHLYEDLPSHIQEAAVRQSRLVLQERYHSSDPVPLRILHTTQIREAMDVRLNPVPAETGPGRELPWQWIGGAAAVVVLVLLVWGVFSLFSGGFPGGAPADSLVVGSPAGENGNGGDTGSASDDLQGGDLQGDDAGATGDSAAEGVLGQAANGTQLPPSRNARNDIRIGVRVQILPGFGLTLRSEAGAQAGEVVGFLADEAQALVVGGPELRQGETDTIVWWLVELEDGSQAWAAANTSQTALLVPAP